MKLLLIIIMLTLISCHTPEQIDVASPAPLKEYNVPADWKRINACGLEFYIPPYLKEQKVQPYDSCVKEYRSENMRVSIDVLDGQPGENFHRREAYSDSTNFSAERVIIDGKQADIITFFGTGRTGLDYGAVLEVPRINLTIWTYCKTQEDRENTIKIFMSVRDVWSKNKSEVV